MANMPPELPPQIELLVGHLESQDPEALVAVFDRDGFYLYASPNHEPAIGYTEAELITMHLSQTVDSSLHHAAWVLRTISVFSSKPIHFSSLLVAKSGRPVRIAGTLQHVRTTAKDERFFVTFTKPVPKS
jgi:PAS domain S-box-containing protein